MSNPGLGVRFNLPYLHGAYLALNAIPDAYFLGDGPNCVFAKAEHIQGRHDLFSTLLSCGGDHRIQYTGVGVFTIAGRTEPGIEAALERMLSWPSCGVLLMGAIPMCALAGTDYERLLREAARRSGKPALLIPRRGAVAGDWLDGYAATLEALARGMELRPGKGQQSKTAIVGYLMDRNEGDHQGNLRELERLLRGLGLEACAIWPSGRPYAQLQRVESAGSIISLPYGREAARVLAGRLGVELIEAELPFGLAGSRRFLELLGRRLGREAKARRLVAAELDFVAPRLEWTVPQAFENRRFLFAGDPHHAAGFAELIEELGGGVAETVVMGAARHLPEPARRALEARSPTAFEPGRASLSRRLEERGAGALALVVGNTQALRHLRPRAPWLEFGFPSESTHFLDDRPFLGFAGALALLSRMANEISKGLASEAGL